MINHSVIIRRKDAVYHRNRLIFSLDVVFLSVFFFFLISNHIPRIHTFTFGQYKEQMKKKKCIAYLQGIFILDSMQAKPNVKNRSTMLSKNINVIWRIWSWEIEKKKKAALIQRLLNVIIIKYIILKSVYNDTNLQGLLRCRHEKFDSNRHCLIAIF